MKKIKTCYMNLSIQRKLLVGTLWIVLVIILTTSGCLYKTSSRIIREQTEKQSVGVINELSINLDHYFELVENSFNYISNNTIVQEELKSKEPYVSSGKEYYSYDSRAGQIRRLLLQGYTSVYMNDIQLYGYNGANHPLYNGEQFVCIDEEAVFQKAEEGKGKCVYYNSADNTGLIFVAKQIKDSLTMEPLGILRASIKVSYLNKMTEGARNSFEGEILLLDENQKIILNSAQFVPEDLSMKLEGLNGSFRCINDKRVYNCFYNKSTDTGIMLISLIPTTFLERTAKELQMVTTCMVIISIFLCIMLTSIIARGIAGPIEQTSNAMKRFAGGDFSVRLPEGRTDEIGAMNSVFNQTIEEVETLLKKIVKMEMINKDIEFQTLQAQINPHFLYNVLDTINWMARKKGEEAICKMVMAVSNLMRISISNKKNMLTLGEELRYIQDYLYIQETRYGSKFISYLEVDESLNDFLIPKMTIQILVENAVVHGVENAIWDCYLMVTGERKDNKIIIRIKDNGVGISEEKLKKLMEFTEEADDPQEKKIRTHTHLGVYSVKKRLDYVYKGKASMEIQSEEGKGTEVILKIPLGDEGEGVNGSTGNDFGR